MTVESAVAIAGGFTPKGIAKQHQINPDGRSWNRSGCCAAWHAPETRGHCGRRRTLVLTMPETPDSPLRILHAARAPVGGIFRHILDLAVGQADRGHSVGILADSLTGGERAEAALKEIAPKLKLGVYRLAIRREPHPIDSLTSLHFLRLA